MDSKKLENIIVDSGAIIKGTGLASLNKDAKYWTVSEVIAEIRDSRARAALEALSFELTVRTPSDAAMKAVSAFASKTGDFAALSLPDLKIMALTYDLEVETNGTKNIRTAPKSLQSKVAAASAAAKSKSKPVPTPSAFPEGPIDVTTVSENCCEHHDHSNDEHAHAAEHEEEEVTISPQDTIEVEESDDEVDEVTTEIEAATITDATNTVTVTTDESTNATTASVVENATESLSSQPTSSAPLTWAQRAAAAKHLPATSHPRPITTTTIPATSDAVSHFTDTSSPLPSREAAQPSRILSSSAGIMGGKAEEDDGVGWVNPSNVKQCRVNGSGMLGSKTLVGDAAAVTSSVACLTLDFSMQNVLLQMGLQVISLEGMLITLVKQWVLRCGACYQIHYQMDRLFCSKCGAHFLQRIAASIDAKTGMLKLHLKKNYRQNIRGMQHSLPKPGKQGKYEGELLLREDQLLSGIWHQKAVKIRKDVRSAFGEDITSDVGVHINKGNAIKVGLGRRNPNADKGRERRGKKKR